MHLSLTVLALMLFSCHAYVHDRDDAEALHELEELASGGQLISMLENIRDLMRTGNESMHIPMLDPFYQKHMDLNFNGSKLITIEGMLEQLSVKHLSDYTIEQGDFQLIGLSANVSLTWKQIDIMTVYNAMGTLAERVPFYGNGMLAAQLKGLNVMADMKLRMNDSKMYIKDLELHFSVDTLNCKITGLFGDEDASNVISNIITEITPGLIKDYQEQLSKEISPIARDMFNNVLKNFTMRQLLELMRPHH